MITLQPITEENFAKALALKPKNHQHGFVADAAGILARGYLYRKQNAVVRAIYDGTSPVGLTLVYDLTEEPACYHLCQLLVDGDAQGKGVGTAALKLLLDGCRRERRLPRVEVCVRKENCHAIALYKKAGFRISDYEDPSLPDSIMMVYELPERRDRNVTIHLTGKDDLPGVQKLWANPQVMSFVGFPEGLHETMEHLEYKWLPWVQNPPLRQHWSVYENGRHCGESFYDVDETGLACVDIKLMPEARGRGLGFFALSHAIHTAFHEGGAGRVYVDPDPRNQKALALYGSLGFLPADRPAHLEQWDVPVVYLEISRERWELLWGDSLRRNCGATQQGKAF